MENSPLALFEHEKFGSLRVIEHKGEPWFVARDVCAVLGTETRDLPDILEHDEQRPIVDIIHTLNDFRTGPVFPHPAFPQARSQGVQAVGDA